MLLGQCLRISFVCVEAELWLNIRVKIRFAAYGNNFFSHTSVIHIMCVITSLVQLLNLDIVQFKSSWVIFGLWPFGPALGPSGLLDTVFLVFLFWFFIVILFFEIFFPVVLLPADLWYDSRFPRSTAHKDKDKDIIHNSSRITFLKATHLLPQFWKCGNVSNVQLGKVLPAVWRKTGAAFN